MMREEQKLTHTELSKLLRTKPPSTRVKGWEDGVTDLRVSQFEEICNALGYEIVARRKR